MIWRIRFNKVILVNCTLEFVSSVIIDFLISMLGFTICVIVRVFLFAIGVIGLWNTGCFLFVRWFLIIE